jgi:hypothetical protein
VQNPQEIEQKLSGSKPRETKRPTPKQQRNPKSPLIVHEDSISFF